MNFLNNSLIATRVRVGAGTGAGIRVGIRAGTRSGPGVELQDRAGEVLPEWEPSIEPGSLASSSSRMLIEERF